MWPAQDKTPPHGAAAVRVNIPLSITPPLLLLSCCFPGALLRESSPDRTPDARGCGLRAVLLRSGIVEEGGYICKS